MATYEPKQRVEVENFLGPPGWLPAKIIRQLSAGMYKVEVLFLSGFKAVAERRCNEIRPVKGDGDGGV